MMCEGNVVNNAIVHNLYFIILKLVGIYRKIDSSEVANASLRIIVTNQHNFL